MKEVKKITENGFRLTHSWYFDDFGLKRNSFNLFHEKKRINWPFMGKMRVNDFDTSHPIQGDDVSPFTDKEYQEMLRNEIVKLSKSWRGNIIPSSEKQD